MSSTNMNIRMDSKVKQDAEILFSELGLNMTAAINLFLRQSIRKQSIPFELALHVPNAETLAAMKEVDEMLKNGTGKRYDNLDDLFAELDS